MLRPKRILWSHLILILKCHFVQIQLPNPRVLLETMIMDFGKIFKDDTIKYIMVFRGRGGYIQSHIFVLLLAPGVWTRFLCILFHFLLICVCFYPFLILFSRVSSTRASSNNACPSFSHKQVCVLRQMVNLFWLLFNLLMASR